MRRWLRTTLAALAGLLVFTAAPARADITVTGRYTLVTGETLTRPSYYTSKQIRTTLPDGNEVIYNHESDLITLVDHKHKRYWEGPRDRADSVATLIRAERFKQLEAGVTPEEREKWNAIYSALSDSVSFKKTGQETKICGYPCGEWVLTAGSYLRQEKWVARSLALPDYSPEVGKVVLATITDPVGRGLMALVMQARAMDGLSLKTHIRFQTLGQKGEMAYEAVKVDSKKLGPEVWIAPAGYTRMAPLPTRK